jgi:phage terminase large subunit GpA-like protein
VEGGQIWQAFLAGTQHKYFVRCPKCQAEQELAFPQIKWPHDERTKKGEDWNLDEVERLAFYECNTCRNPIEQSWRQTMIRGGQWKPTNPKAPADRISFHLNALYSPWRTWGSIAREFLEVKDSFSGLQNFTNSVLAEPWKVKGETVTEAKLQGLRADYELGTIPVKPDFLLLTADVQRDCIYFVVRAWLNTGESWLIDYGRLPTLADLDEVAARDYPIPGAAETERPWRRMIDSGYAAKQVYEYCAPFERMSFPLKGWNHLAQPVKLAQIQFLEGRNAYEKTLTIIHFDDHVFKSELYLRRIQDRTGPPWHIARNTGADYIAQLTKEKLVEKKNQRGIPEQVWHQTGRDNHLGDCEKLQLVGYIVVNQPC